jgi:tetraacyldisaccharide 4'-kinase
MKGAWFYLLYPFSLVYGLVVYIRNFLFDYQIIKSSEFNIPIICVGNITAGGTGKTPHVEYLIRLLKYEFNVACLSRGYKRNTRKYILADQSSTAEEIGDEARQIKKKFPDIHVAVDRNRVNGITRLMQDVKYLDVIMLDDAFQHRYVKAGLSILLIDYNRPLDKDHLLPAGLLREQPFEKKRANIILVTKCPERLKPIDRRLVVKNLTLFPFQHLYFTHLKDELPRPVFKSTEKVLTRDEIKNMKPHILMIAGIANPRSLKKFVRNYSTHITDIIYPDHYSFTNKDIDNIISTFNSMEGNEKIIFTTEKDTMRLEKFTDIDIKIKDRMYFIPVTINFLNEDTDNFNQHILSYVRVNKRNSILYKKKD